MNEDRKRILDLLAAGKITADEAERLIAALVGDGVTTAEPSAPRSSPKYLRVIVDAPGEPGEGATKVNIRVPMMLLRAGVRLGALIPAQARGDVDSAMREWGIPFDLSQIKPENLDAVIEHLEDFSVDVDVAEDGTKVRVFCE